MSLILYSQNKYLKTINKGIKLFEDILLIIKVYPINGTIINISTIKIINSEKTEDKVRKYNNLLFYFLLYINKIINDILLYINFHIL